MLDRPIHELLPMLRERRLRVRDLLQAAVDRHAAGNAEVAAFLHFAPPFEQADRLDAELDAGRDPGPLAGIPVALKDNMCTRGMRTTCGSRMLETFEPPYDATVVRKLRDAGALVVGKTNMDEFAMGSSTENSAFGPTRNPWDTQRVPGGSSGGSAAAVAGGFVPVALGSDTGGSIRQPAAFCGVTGMKPTYGRVSRYGLVAFASSLDQIGPLTLDVRDCATVLHVISGADPADGTCVPEPVPDYHALLDQGVDGLRLGIPRTFLKDLEPAMAASFEDACRALADLGGTLVDVELPNLAYALPTYYILAPAEASSNLARYDGVRYGLRVPGPEVATMMRRSREAGFGAEVKRRIMLGTHTLSSGYHDAYYGRAQKARTVLKRDFDSAFEVADVLLMPTTPTPAFPLGEKSSDPLSMYLSDIYTVAVNLAGLPGLSVPTAPVRGLPAGLQILGRAWDEARVLACGHAYQTVTGHHRARPAQRT